MQVFRDCFVKVQSKEVPAKKALGLVLGRMTETDVKGCQESIKNSARDNNAIAWGLERRVVFDNENTISDDDDVLKIAFDIDYFGSFLRRSGTLTEV